LQEASPWWEQTEFDYIRIPKDLTRSPYDMTLSPESRMLYGLLLDRANLSWAGGEKWRNSRGEPFVIYTMAEIQQRLGCGEKKATKLLHTLREQGLVELSRSRGAGAYQIVVKPFGQSKVRLGTGQKCGSGAVKNAPGDPSKPRHNKTEINNTDRNNTDAIRQQAEYEIKKNIDYDVLVTELPKDKLDAIVEVMTDALASDKDTIRIGGAAREKEAVRKRLLGADCIRIRYIFDHMKLNTANIGSYRAYYLARLWEPEGMVDAFYEAWVRRTG